MQGLNTLQVETTNICNAKCVFCPHDKFKIFGTMTETLYRRIVDMATTLPNLETFIPMLTGEPFCDHDYMERLYYARKQLPSARIYIYTNGSLLTEKIIDALGKIPNIGLYISLNAASINTRKRLMGLDDFKYVAKMLNYLYSKRIFYQTTMVEHPSISLEEKTAFKHKSGQIIYYSSWGGEKFKFERPPETPPCRRLLHHITVRYTGEVNLCCFDPFGQVKLGDLNEQTIEEVWLSEQSQTLRQLHKTNKAHTLKLCKYCDVY